MTTKIHSEFIKRLCPHRGIGEENKLLSIHSAILHNPFLVEFDVQYYKLKLHLGHPPVVNKQSTLADALALFNNTRVLPKVDLKLNSGTFERGLYSLCENLSDWGSEVLVNIDGDLTTKKFLEAETYLTKHTNKNVLLNIDLIRYKNISLNDINLHLESLNRHPFSLSPNLDAHVEEAIAFARKHNISHIHFWAFFDRQYSLDYLCLLMQRVLGAGLQVYFDIKLENITEAQAVTVRNFPSFQLQ